MTECCEWHDSPAHPDMPQRLTVELMDIYEEEDFVDYLGRVADWTPPAPPGFWLIRCDATPRHGPDYVPITPDFYEPPCAGCEYAALREAHAPCEHSHHRRWRRWRWVSKIAGRLYSAGLVRGYGHHYDGHCWGCLTGIQWRWSK